jgi:hypothetical protein
VILEARTHFPSHIVRRAAYDRLVPNGSDSGFLHWMQIKKREFERLHPQHVKRSDESRMAFDRWLEMLK